MMVEVDGVWASALEMGSLWPDYKVITRARPCPWSMETREADLWIEFTSDDSQQCGTSFALVCSRVDSCPADMPRHGHGESSHISSCVNTQGEADYDCCVSADCDCDRGTVLYCTVLYCRP